MTWVLDAYDIPRIVTYQNFKVDPNQNFFVNRAVTYQNTEFNRKQQIFEEVKPEHQNEENTQLFD